MMISFSRAIAALGLWLAMPEQGVTQSTKPLVLKPASATQLLRNNMLIYGVGGVLLPFVAIKLIDIVLSALFNL